MGQHVYVGGEFTSAGGRVVNHVARYHMGDWQPLGEGVNGGVYALRAFGSCLYGRLHTCIAPCVWFAVLSICHDVEVQLVRGRSHAVLRLCSAGLKNGSLMVVVFKLEITCACLRKMQWLEGFLRCTMTVARVLRAGPRDGVQTSR
jgi:hypothetical protein